MFTFGKLQCVYWLREISFLFRRETWSLFQPLPGLGGADGSRRDEMDVSRYLFPCEREDISSSIAANRISQYFVAKYGNIGQRVVFCFSSLFRVKVRSRLPILQVRNSGEAMRKRNWRLIFAPSPYWQFPGRHKNNRARVSEKVKFRRRGLFSRSVHLGVGR